MMICGSVADANVCREMAKESNAKQVRDAGFVDRSECS